MKNKILMLVLLSLHTITVKAAISPLVDAASRGDIQTVQQMLRAGADVSAAQGDGMTALHWAADRGDTELAEMLIFAGANLEAGTRIGHYTALHIATRRGRIGVANALISAGADVTASTTNSGVLPIHLAAASGNADLTAVLLRAGADVNAIEGAWGQTPLVFASAANRIEVMNVLLDAGADPAITSKAVDTGCRTKLGPRAPNRLRLPERAGWSEDAETLRVVPCPPQLAQGVVNPLNVGGFVAGDLRRPQKGNLRTVVPGDLSVFGRIGRHHDPRKDPAAPRRRDRIGNQRVAAELSDILVRHPF